MPSATSPRRSLGATAVYGLLNPIPFGFFMAALIFDITYAKSGEMMWSKTAAWLIVIGLFFAVIPRLINLVQIWGPSRREAHTADRLDFWFYLLAVVAAITNSFVHSRDAYAVVSSSIWLSALTVVLLGAGHLLTAIDHANTRNRLHA